MSKELEERDEFLKDLLESLREARRGEVEEHK